MTHTFLLIRHFLVVKIMLPFALLCLAFQMAYPLYLILHCSLVTCVEARERLTFGSLPSVRLSLPPARRIAQKAPHKALADACGDDGRCVCVNDAIFKHDSSWATAGVGKRTLNPCNMRPPVTWAPSVAFEVYHAKGNGKFAKFDTLSDGITACVELYQRNYSTLPPAKLVARWTDGGGKGAYTAAVTRCFL